MAKGKKKKAPKDDGPVDEFGFPAAPDEIPPVAPTPSKAPMKKVDAVREALKEGHDKPTDGVAFVKKKYGIEMTPQQFSNSKFQLAKTGGKSGGGSPAPVKATTPKTPKAAASTNGQAGGAAALARQIKALVDVHGVAAVKDMADVFAK